MHQRWGRGYQDFPSKIFCLTVPKISVREAFTVAIISGIEKVWIRGGVSRFLSKIFCLTVPKNFVADYFSVSLIAGTEKFVWIIGGEYQDFPSKIFCLTVPKISVRESFTVAIISGIEKILITGGGEYHGFPSKFLSHCTKIFLWRTLCCFRKFLLSKIFMHRRGGASRFCRNFLSHKNETRSFVKEPFCFPEIFWYRKNIMHKRGHITSFS